MRGINNILVVCVGNICRSPTAEFLLRRDLPQLGISSAGLGALVGHDMDAMARRVAEAHGLMCPVHQARQLTPASCRDADLILVMEAAHRDAAARLCPEARGKIFLLAQGMTPPDIADPYRKSEAVFTTIFQQLQQASLAWVRRLSR